MKINEEKILKKEKAPKWTTYFSNSPKRKKVIFKIIFYSQNPKKTCYATLKRISLETKVHINTVYDAVKMACSIGILKKQEVIEIYQKHPLTGKPLFNKNVKLTYLGDLPKTAGEVCFGSPPIYNKRDQKVGINRGYIKEKELSYKRGKKERSKAEYPFRCSEILKEKSFISSPLKEEEKSLNSLFILEDLLQEVSNSKTKQMLFLLEKKRNS